MKNIIRYLNLRNILMEIQLYGYHDSLKGQIGFMLGMVMGMMGIALLLGLNTTQMIVVSVFFLLFLPRLIINVYRSLYEQKKFIDISNYLEQILYSFKRKSKIMSALEDTLVIFPEGNMGALIQQTLEYIATSDSEGDIYKEAFVTIEKEYDCLIVKRVHDFMIRVEANGGEHEASADILIYDRNKWVSRIMNAQKEKQLVKRNVTIGIGLSLIVILTTTYMIPSDLLDIQNNFISQISAIFILLCNFSLWTFVQCKLSNSWIQTEEEISEENVEVLYNKVMCRTDKNGIKEIVFSMLSIVCGGLASAIRSEFWWFVIGIILAYFLYSQESSKYKKNTKKLRREVEKGFPDWILSLALLLEVDNIQGAIHRSIPFAPQILKTELTALEQKTELLPTSIEPYVEFYEVLHIPEVQSAMRILYSMNQNSSEDRSKQIYGLVERNSELQDQSEKLKMSDYLAGMGVCVLVPMVIGCVKMMIDMGLLMFGLINSAQMFY